MPVVYLALVPRIVFAVLIVRPLHTIMIHQPVHRMIVGLAFVTFAMNAEETFVLSVADVLIPKMRTVTGIQDTANVHVVLRPDVTVLSVMVAENVTFVVIVYVVMKTDAMVLYAVTVADAVMEILTVPAVQKDHADAVMSASASAMAVVEDV